MNDEQVSMNNMQKVLAGGVVAVAIVVGGWYAISRQPIPEQAQNSGPTYEKKEAPATLASLREMLAKGVSQSCEFTNTSDSADSKGVVYMSGGKMRGDFESKTKIGATTTVLSHMISDGNETRVWSDGQPMGFLMMKADAPATSANGQAPAQNVNAPVNLDNKSDYKCSPWVSDSTKFTPPPNVTFRSMSDMMKGIPSGAMMEGKAGVGVAPAGTMTGPSAAPGADAHAVQCSVCAQVKDPQSLAQCKAAFQCK